MAPCFMPLKRPKGISLEVNITGSAKFRLSDDSGKKETYELKHEVEAETSREVQKGRYGICNIILLLKLIFQFLRFEA
jgi:hypothetical protein